jgi:uncharacterized HAD superfamily protein
MSSINNIKVKLKADLRPIINFYRKIKLKKEKYSTNKYPSASPLTYFIVDGSLNHGGLTDRLNGIISTYIICKISNIPFRIKWNFPFNLDQYLEPNQYNWLQKQNENYCKHKETKPIIVLNDPRSKALFNIKGNVQNHVYSNMNLLEKINSNYNSNYTWYSIFNELFKPSVSLKKHIEYNIKRIGKPYLGVVFRFQQLLGDFKEGNYKTLQLNEQAKLIAKCINEVISIRNQNQDFNILVTSDSTTFLDKVKNEKNVFIIPGKVVHITFSSNETFDVYMKSFIDFYMLSKAQKVYSVISSEMQIDGHLFLTTFPEYAAKVGNIPFSRIHIE